MCDQMQPILGFYHVPTAALYGRPVRGVVSRVCSARRVHVVVVILSGLLRVLVSGTMQDLTFRLPANVQGAIDAQARVPPVARAPGRRPFA